MLIAWNNLADEAIVTATSEQSTATGANVQNAHVSRKWMAVEGVNSASLIFDLGSAQACAILAVLGSNITSAATLRLRGSNSDSTGVTGEIYDSTSISAGAKSDFGAAYLSFTAASARYWRLDLTDASLTTLQVGRVFLGPKWTPSKNQMYGWGMAVPDQSKVSRSYGGQSFADERPKARVLTFTLNWLTETEIYTNAFAMARANGATRDVLAVQDTAASGYICEQSVFGLCSAGEPIVNDDYGIFRQKFTIEERL